MFPSLDLDNSLDNRDYNCPEENVGEQSQISGNRTSHQEQQISLFSGFERFEDLCFSSNPSPFQLSQEEREKLRNIHSEILELVAPDDDESLPSSLSSFQILSNCRINFQGQNSVEVKVSSSDVACLKAGGQSVNDIIRLAGENIIRSRSLRVDDLIELSQGPSDDKSEDVVVIIQHLLSSAEKIGEQQFEDASNLLNYCNGYSSDKGIPLQRLVYYFSAALRDRIDLEMGVTTSKMISLEIEEAMRNSSSTSISLHQRLPFCQVMQFTAMQAVIENVAQAKKIHLIDLDIKFGTQCSILIQDLASRHTCPVEHLKITALGTKSNMIPAETGKQLMSFAESINLSFSFHVVIVADILDLNENLFELDPDEVTAVYSPFFLWSMIGQQDRLECLMRTIRTINPCVMVVAETEVNHNSPIFVNRFVEALFFFGAHFDCFGDSMHTDDPVRYATESLLGHGIQNIVAAEGKERTIRQVKNSVWVSFFRQFEMVQKELSRSSLYQAGLVAKKFNCGASCSLDMDGKSLIIGWKGTSVLSLSAWEFL
ncbi:putative transcription factor GRAS [Heracleum sosnowskyi]|uniref:Transcription factor GRAS n=1 Tax=Heracleum sosnowskyi TaxID=360622 RepID=A0AAD8ITZ4_9APIA|nr:putative transcription factor GRAS [Heracleum sosnowskyi]